MIDDAHATGFLGKTGRGTPEYCGVMGKIDIITGTLGKALGGASGGFTSGRKEIVDLLRQRSRPYLFSNTIAPPVVAASLRALELLSASTELRDKLARKLAYDRVGYGNLWNLLTVDVKDGVVTLGGEVRTDTDRSSAFDEVKNTKGVKDVINKVNIASTSIYDDDLRVRLARAIYRDSVLGRYSIRPNGETTLSRYVVYRVRGGRPVLYRSFDVG